MNEMKATNDALRKDTNSGPTNMPINDVEEKQTSIGEQNDDKRNRWINEHVFDVFMRLVHPLVGELECDGSCWIAKKDLDKVYERLSPATSIGAIVNSNRTEEANLEKIGFVDVRVLATLHVNKEYDEWDLEVSGTLTLPFVIFEKEAFLLDGYSPERDPITIKFISPRLQGLESANLNAARPAVFKDPPQADTQFVRFAIGRQAVNEADKKLICEFCGHLDEDGLSTVEFVNGTFRLCGECCCQEYDTPECRPTIEERHKWAWQPYERHAPRPIYQGPTVLVARSKWERQLVTSNRAPEQAKPAVSVADLFFSVSELPGGRGDEARQEELLGIAEYPDPSDSVIPQT
jgi:hypothetical protein